MGDQEGCCTERANPCQLLAAPQQGPSTCGTSAEALLSSCLFLRRMGLSPKQHSLPSVNPGNPPLQHTQGPITTPSSRQAQPPCPAPAQHQELLRATLGPLRTGHSKWHQHLLSKLHHEGLKQSSRGLPCLVVSVPDGHSEGRGQGRRREVKTGKEGKQSQWVVVQ